MVVYDVLHSETAQIIPGHQNGPCRSVRLSADNEEVLSCGADAKVRNTAQTATRCGPPAPFNRGLRSPNAWLSWLVCKQHGSPLMRAVLYVLPV